MRTLLALLLATASATVAADDPPFVAAAKARQAKARAFEVTLTVRKEWKGVTPIGSNEKKDFAGTGTAKLAVDGDRFWYSVDVPELTGVRDRVIRRRMESAFDGRLHFLRFQSEVVNGERAGQMDDLNAVEDDPHPPWDAALAPLRWAFRGLSPGSLLPGLNVHELRNGTQRSFELSGREEVIGGERCVEVRWYDGNGVDHVYATRWLIADGGYLPKRALDTVVEYVPHPTLGRLPKAWTITPTDFRNLPATRTTVTVVSFELRESIPDERFVLNFPAGSQVVRVDRDRTTVLVVAADGLLVPVVKEPPPEPPMPERPTRSLGHTLWVVGGGLAVFVVLVVLLRRLARNRTDDSPDSGSSPPLLT